MKKKHFQNKKDRLQTGFTFIEVIIVVLILSVLVAITVSDFVFWSKRIDVDNTTQEFANILRLAQNRTLSSEGSSQYGVYLNTTTSPHQYVMFKGTSYATRDTSADQIYLLQQMLEFFNINLGGGNEIVFNKLTGASQQSGNLSIRSKLDTSQIKTVYIDSSGTVSFSSVPNPSDASRVKDSRHLHFDYSRVIDTNTENITLSFDNGFVIYTFSINAYFISGQIDWSDTISVAGSNQTVRIHTHRLNNPDTQFSIYRDRRLNNKSLKITISGDSSEQLANYSADGLTTDFSSIYVSNFVWQ